MDQHEPPGISPAEPVPGRPTFRRFSGLSALPTAGRDRLAWIGVAVVCALVLAGVVVGRLMQAASRFVADQPAYRLTYREIQLDPPPPAWLKGGREALLERTLGGSGDFQSFSALDFDRGRLFLLFQRSVWVEKVVQVRVAHPNRVTVALEYAEPVAVELAPEPGHAERMVINRDGVILPREDIDFARVGPLIQLWSFEPPVAPTAGETWNRIARDSGQGQGPGREVPEPNARVLAAARFAGFLRGCLLRDAASAPGFPPIVIHGETGTRTVIQVRPNLMILWSPGPWDDRSNDLTPGLRWARVRDYVAQHPPGDNSPSYRVVTARGVERRPEIFP